MLKIVHPKRIIPVEIDKGDFNGQINAGEVLLRGLAYIDQLPGYPFGGSRRRIRSRGDEIVKVVVTFYAETGAVVFPAGRIKRIELWIQADFLTQLSFCSK